MGVRERLEEAGLELPAPVAPVGAYVPAVCSGALVFTSGQVPMRNGSLVAAGRVGGDVSMDEARECAVQCILNALAAASTVCDLDEVERVVKVVGYVASDPAFTGQPGVIDAASDALIAAYSDAGRHAREAVGVAALPLGAPVEVSLVLEMRR
ncbi:MAG TPA: LysR family transcriptional regulator [Coriobacteriia bacterium]|nr:MAG: Endoribonuclease L-PSP [Actinobacteria bacterium 66_15]HAL29422.1 LysR family transcriptional regulator [Coriobacteriia bacterium]